MIYDILRQHVSPEASYDANIVNKPECRPNTRIKILKELADWVDDPNPNTNYLALWAGKLAITQLTIQRVERVSSFRVVLLTEAMLIFRTNLHRNGGVG